MRRLDLLNLLILGVLFGALIGVGLSDHPQVRATIEVVLLLLIAAALFAWYTSWRNRR